MSIHSVSVLRSMTDETWQALRRRVEGLTDDEFFWQPVPGCWSVHEDDHGRWVVDYALPEPQPAPFTTIGWRLVHLATCKIMYHEYAFGPGKMTWDEVPIPCTAADAIAQLEEGQALLGNALDRLTGHDLTAPRLTNWGDSWPTWQIFSAMLLHDAHHGAEIGCLRDLYRYRSGLARGR